MDVTMMRSTKVCACIFIAMASHAAATPQGTSVQSGGGSLSPTQTAAIAGAVQRDGSTPMIAPQNVGTDSAPVVLSNAPSQSAINVNMRSLGTPGIPGPMTAHHGYNASCTKDGYYSSSHPPIGEIDCINIIARQDGLNPSTSSAANDAGDVGGILADIQSTLRAQNFSGFMEEHTSVVDTRTNTVPYYIDMQEGIISTTGHPDDDGTQGGSMQAWFAALIDGHGSGLKIVEQTDTSPQAGKIGHGVIDNVLEAAHYTGDEFFLIDGIGNIRMPSGWLHMGGEIVSSSFALGTDANGNMVVGSPTGSSSNFGSATPYISFSGQGVVDNARLISDGPGQLSIVARGTRNYVFNPAYAAVLPPLTVNQVEVDQKIYLDSSHNMWLQETAGKVVIGAGSTRLFSVDVNGNAVARGTFTPNGSP